MNTHGNHVIVPIAINYESLPEQSRLANEADGSTKTQLCILRLFNWFKVSYAWFQIVAKSFVPVTYNSSPRLYDLEV